MRRAIGAFKAFEHPSLGLAQREFAEWPQARLLDELEEVVHREKEVAQVNRLGSRAGAGRVRGNLPVKFVQGDVRGVAGWFVD